MSLESLHAERYISLATFRKTGREVATPVWFAIDEDGSFVVVTGGESGKVKRLRNSPRSRIAACDVRGGVDAGAQWIDTDSILFEEGAAVRRAHRLLRKKYGVQMVLLDVMAWIGGRLKKREYLRILPSGGSASAPVTAS